MINLNVYLTEKYVHVCVNAQVNVTAYIFPFIITLYKLCSNL